MPVDFSMIEDQELKTKLEAATNEAIKASVDEAVAGLKSKNEELIGEKRKIQDILKQFDGLDPVKAAEALKFLEGNEEAQLIKDGKFNELIEKRTSVLKSDYEAKLSELTTINTELKKSGDNYKTIYERKLVEDALREVAIQAKVRPEALVDILMRGTALFSVGADGSVEARDRDGKLLKNDEGLVVSPKVWIESLKSMSPHYWPESEGAGFRGRGGSGGDDTGILADAASSGNMDKYRKLRRTK